MRLSDVLLLPEKTYTGKGNGVQGKILAVGQVTVNGEWSNQPISLQGIDNTKCNITHSSKHPDSMLNASHIGKDTTWRLKWWNNSRQQRQEISGYPEFKIEGEPSMTAQPNPALPYNQPQSNPQPLQQANPTARTITPDGRDGMRYPEVYGYPPTPESQGRMTRSVAVEAASHVVAAWVMKEGVSFDVNGKLLEISDILAMWIKEGTAKAPEPQAQGVCPSCQLLRVDCTCPQQDFIR